MYGFYACMKTLLSECTGVYACIKTLLSECTVISLRGGRWMQPIQLSK